jgi:uncharacterized membrane protein YcaP (DUF421 family)
MLLAKWLNDVFTHPDPHGVVLVALKTTIVYLFLVVGLRLLGKRELGQMTIYDLVLIIVLANSVQNAMVGDDTTLMGGIVAATVLLFWNRMFTLVLERSPRLERYLVGQPLLIVNKGHLVRDRMAKEGVTVEQVKAALREHGLHSLDQARMCVLEVDGTISVVPEDATVYRSRHHFKTLRMP